MDGFLDTALSFPTVIYSLFFVVVTVYWLFVVLGALDIDMIDLGGDLDGLAEGAAEGVADGAAEGIAEGATESAADAVAEGASSVGLGDWLTALRLRSAPVTVTFSLVVAFGWLFSYLGTGWLAPTAGAVMPSFIWGTLLLVASLVLAVPLTAVLTRPLSRVFETHKAPTRESLLGQLCELRTGRVDAEFGQAEISDGGAGHLVEVRCDHENDMVRGDQALVIDYDRQREAFIIEPMEHILTQPSHEIVVDDDVAEALAEA